MSSSSLNLILEKQIKILPEQLVNQIAAGEVIERPASAIKELIDNAIDAGADNIQVQIISADGRSFRITDNGIGIPEDQIELAFTKHATSKLSSLDDLTKLQTKGFRGEALASINAVADVICFTKHIHSETAIKAYFNTQGELIKSPAALSEGTSFEVNNLFGYTPVRLKFLKRSETELRAIEEIVRELAIAHSHISFDLEIKGKQIFKTSGSNDWEQTVREVLQESISFKYLEVVKEQEPIMELKGLVAPLSEARSDSKSIITLVNQRPIQCQIMRKAIKSVYQPFLPTGKYPKLILSLTLPMDQIDINVHPTKREIRYASPGEVYKLVQSALEKHLIISSSQIKPLTNSSNEALDINLVGNENQQRVSEFNQINFANQNSSRSDFPQNDFKSTFSNSKERPTSSLEDILGIGENKLTNTDNLNINQTDLPSINSKERILQISSLELTKTNNASDNKSYRAEIGNSTDFCIQADNLSVSGQIGGPKWIRDRYLSSLSNWLNSVDQDWNNFNDNDNAKQIRVFPGQEPAKSNINKLNQRPKINKVLLEEIWQRDGWRCVYCGKHLIHPHTAKLALRSAPEDWIQRIGSNNKLIKTHLFREHQATYDHYFPHSHNPSLSRQEDNLFACCKACNQEKSNSTNYHKWQPKQFESWISPLTIGSHNFVAGKLFNKT
jgi:DNA mismatch repair protein MutL